MFGPAISFTMDRSYPYLCNELLNGDFFDTAYDDNSHEGHPLHFGGFLVVFVKIFCQLLEILNELQFYMIYAQGAA